jgi:hypothetical protein
MADQRTVAQIDPTAMTTAALLRETGHLEKSIDARFYALREEIEARLGAIERATAVAHDDMVRVPTLLDKAIEQQNSMLMANVHGLSALTEARFTAMDKALTLLQAIADRQPDEVDRKIGELQKLHEEKFESVATQFKERDVRTESTQRDSKVAVDAALKAQQEAFAEQNKSSALAIAKSETSTSKQLDLLAGTISSNDKATDGKIADVKERLTRIEGTSKGHGETWGYIVGAIGILATVVSLVWYVGHLNIVQ